MTKYSSKGTQLKVAVATVLTAVGGVKSINGPNPETQFFDATDLDSDHLADGEPTGQSAPGSVSGELFYDPDDPVVQSLIAQITAPGTNGKVDWSIAWPDASATTGKGTCKSFNPKASVGEGLLADFEIKNSTMPTFPS